MPELFSAVGKWLLSVLFWLVAFTAPARESMGAILFLIVTDLIVGVWASKVRGEPFISWKLRHTVTRKIAPYFVAIICALDIEQRFFSSIPLMKAVAGLIAVSEGKSIFERLGEITGLDFWNVIREKLQPTVKLKETPKDKPDA